MIAHRIRRGEAELRPRPGWVLCHDVRDGEGRVALRKGAMLGPAELARLESLPWETLHLIEMEPSEVHEEEAGWRVAEAVAGKGVEVRPLSAGAWPLVAGWRGLFQVEVDALRRLNSLEGASVYTLYHGQVVEAGETVARAKIIPLVMRAAGVRAAEALAAAAEEGVLRVRPFVPLRVGAVVLESLGEEGLARFGRSLGEKIAWFGSELLPPLPVPACAEALESAVERLLGRGAQLIVVAGARAMDPLNPAFEALRRMGTEMERLGVPAHPGSLLWLARRWEVPILGMPSCGLFSQATVFDLVLPRVLAGERIDRESLAELGHGGLLSRDMAFRFPPYRPTRERGELA